ncbi:hypothetical protein J5N97_024405 [Dioscorea zingiberensis]|uniref:EF-hand domain-containing protein n=1 Tax=Dioscorea zingiberensis TaxID=325984 RepID=A0A9D5H911_9LILI|nr:hypothetical protein J5N97_024405 [Dioscorea zingiberensis]
MAAWSSRIEKVRRILERFDLNGDGGLDRSEMAALVAAVNHLPASTLPGLLRTNDGGVGDLDRDLAALKLSEYSCPNPNNSIPSPIPFPSWISSPN